MDVVKKNSVAFEIEIVNKAPSTIPSFIAEKIRVRSRYGANRQNLIHSENIDKELLLKKLELAIQRKNVS